MTINTTVKLSCAKQRDLRISGMYPQLSAAAKCPSLDAEVVHKVQNYIDLTFGLLDFEVIGHISEFFWILIHVSQFSYFARLPCQLRA